MREINIDWTTRIRCSGAPPTAHEVVSAVPASRGRLCRGGPPPMAMVTEPLPARRREEPK
eukprot:COSAG01_NODE_909_length_12785_cov_4.201876_11_plen_60_part_00